MKILQNYIIGEILAKFLLTATVFTGIVFVGGSFKLLSQDVPFVHLMSFLPFLVPSVLSYTLPLASLTAALLAYGRLSADNEVLAAKACGVSPRGLVLPVMLFGLMTSMLGFVINDQVAPFCRERVEHQLRASRQSLVTFQLLLGRTMAEFPGFKLWAGSCRDRILDDVEIYRTTGSTGGDLIMARQGEVLRESSDERLRIELLDGNILTWPEEGRGESVGSIAFTRYRLEIPLTSGETRETAKRLSEMTIGELWDGFPLWRPFEVLTHIHKKIAMSFSSLALVILGAALGIAVRKESKLVGFGVGLFVGLVVYYPLLLFGNAMGMTGTVPPWMALWMPNILVGGLGVFLIYRAAWR